MTTLREVAWNRIEKLGQEIVSKNAGMTKEQAIAQAVRTPEGIEAYALYDHPYADLPLEEAIAKISRDKKLAELGFDSWGGAVSKTANAISPDDFVKGLNEVARRYPAMYEAYKRESR